ncbi:Aromatic ring-opening dioxygenase, catalytic subunit, LigB family [Peptoclostridium litorale DSM 5388]|uniref:Extradiol ring-cleavage dioxygenase class III protein subunit B n=1 Tax=Peptoclostridium litorale DSM 5388 TaxID=1121324 RepID=A0A069RIV2_PEPLI|nr:class III extradiol ring-cleavage dioxygenase [Peptoclostridium litorale]KDR94157.1 extradiol ring-cleavage dioxygenase class III protein subunit B [Peptoclostridium litorale DSM 5388]SIN81595.1 Aromatic ring-opening dioxygenase, catalytic subunit, LigB family [Peptoclostridium litorale DSM 5388]
MCKDNVNHNGQIIYFSHGGGPLPMLDDPSHDKMIRFMKNLPYQIQRPDSIIVFSAHWEEDVVTIQSGSEPEIMYDYYGFPEAAYSVKYPCKGNSELAFKIAELFKKNGIKYRLDDKRPYDHGSYIPLKMMYPNADIPVIQISLHHNLDPLTHLNVGKALRPLLEENLLIIGSGFSFHNMRRFDFEGKNTVDPLNDEFQDKLIEICCGEKNEEKKREDFIHWENIPGARYCHPREEHLLPLLVCVGLSKGVAAKVFDDYILGKRATAFLWK